MKIIRITGDSMKEVLARKQKEVFKSKETVMAVGCMKGRCNFKVANGESYELKENDFIFYGYEIYISSATVSDDFQAWAIVCKYSDIESMNDPSVKVDINRLVFRPRVLTVEAPLMSMCNTIAERMKQLLDMNDIFGNTMAMMYLKLMIYGSSNVLRKSCGGNDYDTKREHIISDKFIELVVDNFKEHRKEQFYADKLGVSSKYLTTVVKKATGRAPCDWIDDYTLYHIKQALSNRNTPVQEICFGLDFATPSHFTKFFKDKTGMTPSAYRKSLE